MDGARGRTEPLGVPRCGTRHERPSVFDGIPRHLPALLRAEKLVKKARKAALMKKRKSRRPVSKSALAQQLFALTKYAQQRGWSAEELLRSESQKQERAWRKLEARRAAG